MGQKQRKVTEADVLCRFRRNLASQYLPSGGTWSDQDEGKRIGGVYVGRESLDRGNAEVAALAEVLSQATSSRYSVPNIPNRGLFADATYRLRDRLWVFEIKTRLRNQQAFAVGSQAWLYREIIAEEDPLAKLVRAWVIAPCFEGNRLYRRVFLNAFVEKLGIGLCLLDEGWCAAPQDLMHRE